MVTLYIAATRANDFAKTISLTFACSLSCATLLNTQSKNNSPPPIASKLTFKWRVGWGGELHIRTNGRTALCTHDHSKGGGRREREWQESASHTSLPSPQPPGPQRRRPGGAFRTRPLPLRRTQRHSAAFGARRARRRRRTSLRGAPSQSLWTCDLGGSPAAGRLVVGPGRRWCGVGPRGWCDIIADITVGRGDAGVLEGFVRRGRAAGPWTHHGDLKAYPARSTSLSQQRFRRKHRWKALPTFRLSLWSENWTTRKFYESIAVVKNGQTKFSTPCGVYRRLLHQWTARPSISLNAVWSLKKVHKALRKLTKLS